MALNRDRTIALGVAVGLAAAMPLTLLWPGMSDLPDRGASRPLAVVPPAIPAIAAVYERELFAAADGDIAPADAPALLGIAGRLNRDAVALVRLPAGGSRSLAVGESVEGWRLESLAIDAAFFTRGRERVRVAMTAVEDAATDQ